MHHPNPEAAQIILDSVTDGVFTVDEEWRITFFNAAARRITGILRDDAMGRRCCEVLRASICETDCALRQTLASGRPVVNKAIYIIDADGRRVPVSISTAILRDGAGAIVGGVETFRDLSQVEELQRELEGRYRAGDIIGRSVAMRSLFDLLPAVADSDSTIVIRGESGTGKELFARAIHDLSPRRDHRFVAINCGALPDALLESELFGYRAGAFTDARKDKPGRFALAEGGTILLDEIGDISPALQIRLLRVLQERVYEPLGAVEPVTTDVRVITATHRDLEKLVREGRFREDLYYRINVFRLDLPNLRDHREDIPLLVDHFISRFNRIQNKDVVGVSDEVMGMLMAHEFPGNARELENIIEHAFVLCQGGLLETHHLPRELLDSAYPPSGRIRGGATLDSLVAFHIREALRRHDGNRTAVAAELGIHTTTLARKMKVLGIAPPARDGRSRKGRRRR